MCVEHFAFSLKETSASNEQTVTLNINICGNKYLQWKTSIGINEILTQRDTSL